MTRSSDDIRVVILTKEGLIRLIANLKPLGTHNYFVYITTNINKKVIYTGVTNNLAKRLFEHKEDSLTDKKHFAGKYNCYNLIHYERFEDVNQEINREKQIKGWTRKKKIELINSGNPEWNFLNDELG